ncbi:hypothetical protein ACET3Z_024874 [Daucus carota]
MVMGAHVAPLVRAPTLQDTRTSTNGSLSRRGRKFTRRRYTLSSYGILNAEPLKLLFLVLFLWSGVVLGGPDMNTASLIRFKSSLANADEALSDWLPDTAPCPGNQEPSWFGVICSQEGVVWGIQLEKLNLSGEIDVDALTALPLLRTLSFMNNQFDGPLPAFKKIGPLKTLYLSNNNFAGPIADDAFEGMDSLKKLHLANNQFTGNIPTSISSPRLLEAKFENNQFEGRIPEFPPGLKVLDLSNNKLEGPIPKSINSMDPAAFKGNKKLCGPPLDTPCPTDAPAPSPDKSPIADGNPGDSSTSAGRIIIIVLICLLALAAVIVLYIIYHRRNNLHSAQLGRTMSNSGESAPAMEIAPPAAARVKKADQQQQHGKLAFIKEDRQRFELQDLLRASAEVLGSGSFGSSYKAVLMDGQAVVVKRFKQMSNVGREEFHEHMRRLGRLNHPNLLPLVAYYYRKEEKLLVFDFVYNGSLAGHLHKKHTKESPGLNWPIRLNIIKGVAKGMSHLYDELPSLVVPHGHLKSTNVLLDKSFQPLLMDYTLLPVVNASQAHQLLTAYRSPEYAQQGHNTKKSDVWCLGVLILEILTGQFPANYILSKGDFTNWINTITSALPVLEVRSVMSSGVQVFDQDMGSTDNAKGEMVKLLKIGLNCCESEVDKRPDMNEAVSQILSVNERDL